MSFHNILGKGADPSSKREGFKVSTYGSCRDARVSDSYRPAVGRDPAALKAAQIRSWGGSELRDAAPPGRDLDELAPHHFQGHNLVFATGPNLLPTAGKFGSCVCPAVCAPCSPAPFALWVCEATLGADGEFGDGRRFARCYSTPFIFALSPCRYCGERSQFVVASTTNKIEVRFHSDQSHTDSGFSAEYLSYDSSDRELKP